MSLVIRKLSCSRLRVLWSWWLRTGLLALPRTSFASHSAADGQQLYALALNQHNGAGSWPVGPPGRWREQGIVLKPWRMDGEHVLVLPQRGIGPAGVAMPLNWLDVVLGQLRTLTKRPVRVRTHPGNVPTQRPLEADLAGAWAVVTWGSGAAVKALCAGIPVFGTWSNWIGAGAARPFPGDLEMPLMDDVSRETTLDRLAWAQWTTVEILTGEPFRRLLAVEGRQAAA